jgi:hypothetical protein
MSDKKLNITADLKLKTTESERLLKKVTDQATSLSKILTGLNVNTRGGKAGFSKSLVEASREMLKLRGATIDTARVMEYNYGRTIERQTKRIDDYTKKIDTLNKKFKEQKIAHAMYTELGNTPYANRTARLMDRTSEKIMVAESVKMSAVAAQRAFQEKYGPNQGSGSGGPPPWQMNWAAMQQALGFSKMLTGSIGGVAGVYQSYKTVGAQNLGHIRDFERGLLGRMAGGDFSDLYFATRKMEGGKNALRHGFDQYGGTGAGALQTSADAVGNLIDVGLGGMRMAGKGGFAGKPGATGSVGGAVTTRDIANTTHGASQIIGGLTGTATSLANRALGGPEVSEVQSMMTGLEAHKLQDPMTQMALQWTSGTAGMRVGAAKALQGRHMGAWGIGQGFGLDMGESMAAAQQLARQFGVNATMLSGKGTSSRQLIQSDLSQRDRDLMEMAGMEARIRAGEKVPSLESYRRSIGRDERTGLAYNTTTSGGSNLLRDTLSLERKGFDRGVAGSSLGTMMMATGGNLASANRQLEDVMTKAFGRGVVDARLGEEIVKATGDAAIGAGGPLQNMAAFGMMLSGGLSGNSTMHDVQSNVGGARAFDSLIKGNQYFSAVQLEAAKQTLGSGATGTQMLAIQRATMGDLMGNSKQLSLAGVSQEQQRAILGRTANSLMGTYLTNSQDPATADLRSALGSNGGDIIKTFQGAGDNKKKLMDQFALTMSLNSGMSQSDSEGLARVLSGVDSKADAGSGRRNYVNRGDGVAEATVRAQQGVLDEFFKKEREIQDEYLKALKAARPIAETIGQNDPAFDAFQKFFTQFMEVMQKAMQDPRLRSQLTGGMTQKGG